MLLFFEKLLFKITEALFDLDVVELSRISEGLNNLRVYVVFKVHYNKIYFLMKSKIKIFSCFGNTQQIEWHCFLCLIIMKNKKNQDKQLVKTNESVKEEKMSKKKEEFPGYPHYPQDEDVLSS